MADANVILSEVKNRKNITGEYHDGTLLGYIADAILILRDSGVSEEIIDSAAVLGCITSMVTDMWDNVGGAAEFSPLTQKRIIQLACKNGQNVPPIPAPGEDEDELIKLVEYTYNYTTVDPDETTIPVGVSGYDQTTEVLDVYINGFKLIEKTDYVDYNAYIKLTKPVAAGTVIELRVIRPEKVI